MDTNFYSTVKTHTPLIDLDQCLEYSDVPRYKDINIKDEYAKSQKFINVNAKVHNQLGKIRYESYCMTH